MSRSHHEDPSIAKLMAAELAQQARTLADWGLPQAGILILMSPCENRCFFCAQPAVNAPPRDNWTPWERIARLLEANRRLGLSRLCIGGTEPVTHPSFSDALHLATETGFTEIELMTSGLHLAEPCVAEQWRKAGITQVAIPVYSADAQQHNSVCGSDCHEALVSGLDQAQSAGIKLHLHTLALRRTLAGLPNLARLCQQRWAVPIALAPARPKEGVWDFNTEAPSIAEVRTVLERIPSEALTLLGWPACLDPSRDRGASLIMSLYFRGQMRGHPPVCGECAIHSGCSGLLQALHDRDGSSGLAPVVEQA